MDFLQQRQLFVQQAKLLGQARYLFFVAAQACALHIQLQQRAFFLHLGILAGRTSGSHFFLRALQLQQAQLQVGHALGAVVVQLLLLAV